VSFKLREFSVKWPFFILSGLIFPIITAATYLLFAFSPQLCERLYGQLIYPAVKWVQFFLFSFFPVPGYWIIWPAMLVGLILLFVVERVNGSLTRKLLGYTLRVLMYLAFWASLFYWLWGYNYLRPDFSTKSGLYTEPVSAETVFEMLDQTIVEINNFWQISADTTFDLRELNDDVEMLSVNYGYTGGIPVSLNHLRPNGILMRWSSAGIYMPFTGQSNLDHALLRVQIPFTAAHEIAHSYGVTDEGVCNFIALIACIESNYPYVRYSGWLSFYRYVAWEARKLDKDLYSEKRMILSPGAIADLESIRENSRKYPDLIPQWRDVVYDNYLKSQGLKQGTESYNQIVMLKAAFDQQLMKNK
jgi:hypothetical protein